MSNEKVATFVLRSYLHELALAGKIVSKKGKLFARPGYSGKQGLYSQVSVLPDSLEKIFDFVDKAIFDRVDENLHSSVMSSEKALPLHKAKSHPEIVHDAKAVKLEWWSGHDNAGYLVLLLDSLSLKEEHDRLKKLGCIHSFPDYTPHITIMQNVDKPPKMDIKYANLLLRRNPIMIQLGNQIIEDLSK